MTVTLKNAAGRTVTVNSDRVKAYKRLGYFEVNAAAQTAQESTKAADPTTDTAEAETPVKAKRTKKKAEE